MATYRRLPSGKWQATVRLTGGRRTTRTSALKGSVKVWAEEEERKIRRGEWIDPKMARTVGQWLDLWSAARVVEPETARGDTYSDTRARAEFATAHLGAVTRVAVQSWVKKLSAGGLGPASVRKAYNYLAAAMNAAVDEGLIVASPCRRITLPKNPPRKPPWFTPEQVEKLVGELDEPHATMTLVMCWTGLRWGECAGLRVQDVDWLRRRVMVVGAMGQDGVWKEYPKTSKSRRELPADEWLIERMAACSATEGLIFRTRRQARPLSGSNWRVVWDAAIARAKVPAYTPHACRHTCASWLVQDGVPLFDVSEFLGHEDPKTTLRYAHLVPDSHGRAAATLTRLSRIRRMGAETGL